jgi:hypothetical protein
MLKVSLRQAVRALFASMLAGAPAYAQLAPAGSGQVRALVIGADHYVSHKSLRGAVADARDLDRALRKGGVRDLSLLLDEQITRRDVESAMDRLVAAAGPDDLVIVTFAGHGSQAPERIKGSDPDGMDEVFVLPRFENQGPPTAERILDKEINVWLRRIEQRGAHALFLADTCHGGGLTRNVDLRAGDFSYRQTAISIAPLDDALTPISTANERLREPEEFDRVTFLAAADKWTKAPELRIEGQPTLRGALSYALARALEGVADRNGDGKTTRRELFEYARQVVQQYSQGRQVIYTEPMRRIDLMDEVVFRSSAATAPHPSVAEPQAEARSVARVAVLNATAAELAGVEPDAAQVALVGRDEQPDIVWDAGSGDVISPLGDVIARNIKLRDLAGVIDRTAAIAAIAKLSEANPQRVTLGPDDKHHRENERVAFRADDVKGKALLLFNLASDGTVQFLFPRRRDKVVQTDMSIQIDDIEVKPPFGADHVVAIASERPLPALAQAISAFDGVRAAGRIPGLLRKHLAADPSIRIGFAGLFTVP